MRCGERRGYQDHKRRGEEACQPCKAAHADYQADYRARLAATEWDDLDQIHTRDPYEALADAIGRTDRGWMDSALCAQIGGDWWFPDKGESTKEAREICERCLVAEECLQYALDHHPQSGIWAGTSKKQRYRLAAMNRLAEREAG